MDWLWGLFIGSSAGRKYEKFVGFAVTSSCRFRIQPGPCAIDRLTFNGPGVHAKTTIGTTLRAQPVSSVKEAVALLFVRSEEEIVGPIGHELSLTRGAEAGRNSSAAGVQTLDEGCVG